MRLLRLAGVAAAISLVCSTAAASAATPTPPFSQCPAVGADTGCALLIYIDQSGATGIAGDPSQGPFDGTEDTLIGVQNNSSHTITSLPLASTTAKGLFAFDADGLCTFGVTGCPFGLTGYEGPGTAFTNISADTTTGTVTFTPGISPGGHAYFSLEEALATQPPFDFDPGTPTTSAFKYVAMGDSFSSGEGLDPYETGTDTTSNRCHHSVSDAYSSLLASDVSSLSSYVSVACSGATTHDFFSSQNSTQPAQLDQLAADADASTQAVTLTVGGDDAGFGQALHDCADTSAGNGRFHTGGSGCANRGLLMQLLLPALCALGGTNPNGCKPDPLHRDIHPLIGVFAAIHTRAPNAKIIIGNYPHLFGDPHRWGLLASHHCLVGPTVVFNNADALALNDGVDVIDDLIARQVIRAQQQGLPVLLADAKSEFAGHGRCDSGQPWVNGVNVLTNQSGSFHPTQQGQQAYERAFKKALNG